MKRYQLQYMPVLFGFFLSLRGFSQGQTEKREKTTKRHQRPIFLVGSRINSSATEGAVDVITITRDSLMSFGYYSLADVIRDLPQNSFGNFFDKNTDTKAPGLLGVGSSHTLILVNGRRVVKDASTELADISMIPLAAIQEVQILQGGASAIYGSDAFGGVINIITRKDFNGTTLSSSYATTKLGGGEEAIATVVWGSRSGHDTTFSMVQYQKSQPLFWRDRGWTDSTKQFAIGDPAAYLSQDGNFYTVNSEQCSVSERTEFIPCRDNGSGDWNYFQNELGQLTAFNQYRRTLGENHEFSTNFFFLNKEIEGTHGSNYLNNYPVPLALLDGLTLLAPPRSIGNFVLAQGVLNAAGPRISHSSIRTYSLETGLQGFVTDTIDYAAQISFADSSFQRETKNALIMEELFEAMEEGKFNPFKPRGEQGSLESAKINLYGSHRTQLTMLDFGLSGVMLDNWAGEVEFASGFNLVKESMKVDDGQAVLPDDEGNFRILGYSGTSRGAERKVASAYLEMKFPLLADLNFTTAGRVDQFSDVDHKTTPAVSLEYRPTTALTFRIAYTAGFKAPTLEQINTPRSQEFSFGRDYRVCGVPSESDSGYCAGLQPVNTYAGGNKKLKPETSQTTSLGFAWDLSQNFRVTGFLYNLETADEITSISIEEALSLEADHKLPNDVNITRDDLGKLVSIELPFLNLGKRKSQGYNIGLAYRLETRLGRLVIDENLAVKTISRWQNASGRNYDNDLQRQPKWRNKASVSWKFANHSLSLVNHHIDAKRWRADGTPKVPSFNYWDLHCSYGFARESSIRIGSTNMTQVKPPVDSSSAAGLSRGITPSLYGVKGPSYYVSFDYSLF